MNLIVTLDDRNGMAFNHRRQSQDKALTARILTLTAGSRLWVNHYTAALFSALDCPQLNVDDNFLFEAGPGEFCFVENTSAAAVEKWVEQIILFRWNRRYPGDVFFDIDVSSGWTLTETEEFAGHSHEKITMEVYSRA